MVNDRSPIGHELSETMMGRAIARAAHSRLLAPPNPWVGAVLVCDDGTSFEGGTQRPGDRHAERMVLDRAGSRARGATLYVTLEPCSHTGRTGPCVGAIIEAQVGAVVVAVLDPDHRVAGTGVSQLRDAGIEVTVGPGAQAVQQQLRPYLHHRVTGRPWVINKIASTIDGRTAAPDGTSQWITGPEARADAHRLRAESDAILVGAGTVRSDNPRLTVRNVTAPDGLPPREPRRIVLGSAPADARIHPCTEYRGDLGALLDRLGSEGILQLMLEGGARVAHAFHSERLINLYVHYLAAAVMGGSDGSPVFDGIGAATISDLWRGQVASIAQLGDTLRVDILPIPD
ncbi:MAG: bifunctional diaminohydroxyphosphoribosylaminopyrimidine deaminase/5-amino-6-(5-phosphoribosylamino)uracil reductase RibD [Acidimicrobiales bacterium]|nr:bifunctional diaminohydroxyphosphoribosylaminopyrimidine deaminase/5-amino-6-(5-phosphoribosylamino)uracil reductase RibD [Acidimicrobiales bacterium]